ncbi:MAG: bifunctional precorrin-2 dehydrogenase/sirohydrochlorin ferrochelatase [Thaumarchaeota archaeon]|nr:bifunctional precorrin-2 dehydrogenase/sirohydrochlorin ferrochelatase [Nitrososphaerota archaeon]
MIVDLNLKGNLVIVVGGGNEGLKKVNALLTQDCRILLISDKTNRQIDGYVAQGKIEFRRMRLASADFIRKYRPFAVLATTDDRELNRKIVQMAKRKRCYAYAADDPEFSDFAFGSVINIADTVQIAVSTGGKSPAMARKLRMQAEKVFRKLITRDDIYQIRLQDFARRQAKGRIETFQERRKFLYRVMNDNRIKQLIADGKLKRAQARVIEMLGEKG